MLPCNTASEPGQTAVNENKWLHVGHEYPNARDEKKVPNHLKCETGAKRPAGIIGIKKKKKIRNLR